MTDTADAARLIADTIDETSEHHVYGYEACSCRVPTSRTAPAVVDALLAAGWTPPPAPAWTRKFQDGDLATIDAARAWDECGAFEGFDATGRTVRIVRPQYDPGADTDPGYWVTLHLPDDGEPDTTQWVAADCLTPIPAAEG